MAAIADFAGYPAWVAHLGRCEVLETGPDGRARRVRFLVEGGPVKDDYELAYTWHGDDAVQWTLVRSRMQRAQTGSYRLSDSASGGTEVRYDLSVEPAVRMPGLLKRAISKTVVDSALKGLKRHVEARDA